MQTVTSPCTYRSARACAGSSPWAPSGARGAGAACQGSSQAGRVPSTTSREEAVARGWRSSRCDKAPDTSANDLELQRRQGGLPPPSRSSTSARARRFFSSVKPSRKLVACATRSARQRAERGATAPRCPEYGKPLGRVLHSMAMAAAPTPTDVRFRADKSSSWARSSRRRSEIEERAADAQARPKTSRFIQRV